jgi:hypothetical protein
MAPDRPLRLARALVGVAVHRDLRWYPSTWRRPGERWPSRVAKGPVRTVRFLGHVLRALRDARALRRRLHAAPITDAAPTTHAVDTRTTAARGLDRCDVVYLNLDRRSDRRAQFEQQMQRLGRVAFRRFPAVPTDPGMLGCSLSHLSVLESWDATPGRMLLVCEDDAQFLAPRATIDALIEEFAAGPELSVLALANNTAWHLPLTDRLAVSADIRTTACYVVKPEAVGDLAAAARRSCELLEQGERPEVAAVDVVWRQVQRTRTFALPRERVVVQASGYSDIERRIVDYGI